MTWIAVGIATAGIGMSAYGAHKSKKGGVEKTSTLSPKQKELMDKYSPYLGERIGEGLPAWGGDWTVPYSEDEKWGLGQYRENIEGMEPDEINKWYMDYIAPSERRHMQEDIIPGIKESMVSGGNLRSTGTENAISDAWSKYGEGQLGRIGEAIMGERAAKRGMLPDYMRAAATPRMIEQADLTSQINEMVRTTPELSPILDKIQGLLNTTTQAAYYQPGKKHWMSTVGPALTGMGGRMIGNMGAAPSPTAAPSSSYFGAYEPLSYP